MSINVAKFLRDLGRAIATIVGAGSGPKRRDPWMPPPSSVPVPPVTPEPTPEPVAPIERLFINGRQINRVLRGVTSFKLLYLYLHDRPAYERAVADVLAHGFNLVRVLTSCRGMFHLDAGQARQSLSGFLADLRARGLYVSVVALADTASWSGWREHAEQVARIIESHDNALYEWGNEIYHPTQDALMHDVAWSQREFDRIAPRCVGTVGPPANDEDPVPAGDFLTRHLDRSRDKWNMVRRVRELEWLSGETQKPVVNWEPIGFGERDEPGRRVADRDIALAFGVLSRIFSVPTVFHCESGLSSSPLGPTQSICAQDFVAGTKFWPDAGRLIFKNATWHDSPVKAFDTTAAVRVYSGVSGNSGLTVVLGRSRDPRIEWQHGWRVVQTIIDRPAIVIYRIQQG